MDSATLEGGAARSRAAAAVRRCAACAVLLAFTPGALGDEIHAGGDVFSDVTLRNFDGRHVLFSESDGDLAARPVEDILRISATSVAGLDAFNRAETLLAQQRHGEAAAQYRLALPRSRGFWTHLIRARTLVACDRAGDLQGAVEAYAQLAVDLPDAVELPMPQRVADADAAAQRRALDTLRSALPKVSGRSSYWALEALRLTLLEASGLEDAGRAAGKIIETLPAAPQAGSSGARLKMIALRVEVKHAQYEVALRHIREAIADSSEDLLPELLFLKGKCQYELARTREDYIRSGLAFMRVVIHFPKSRFCAESMLWTAMVHEKINRPAKALELYHGCTQLPGADDRIGRLAADAIARLQGE